jgi:branched-chain amino acid transport system substrate-binding protein
LAGKAAAGYAYNKWGAKTAGVIAEEKDYTLALKDVFTQNFTELGGKVVMTETFPTGTTDFATASAKVKNLNPDMVYILPQTPTPGVLLVKTLKAQGVKSKILTAEVLLIRDAVAEQGQILEGVTGIEALFDETRPQTKKFIELFKKEYNLDLNWPSYMAGMYDILYLIKGAYEAGGPSNGSGAKTADEVASWLYNLKKWEGAVGDLQFDSHGDPTMTYSIRQINNFSAPQVDTYVP